MPFEKHLISLSREVSQGLRRYLEEALKSIKGYIAIWDMLYFLCVLEYCSALGVLLQIRTLNYLIVQSAVLGFNCGCVNTAYPNCGNVNTAYPNWGCVNTAYPLSASALCTLYRNRWEEMNPLYGTLPVPYAPLRVRYDFWVYACLSSLQNLAVLLDLYAPLKMHVPFCLFLFSLSRFSFWGLFCVALVFGLVECRALSPVFTLMTINESNNNNTNSN